jgi:hypothetical protein
MTASFNQAALFGCVEWHFTLLTVPSRYSWMHIDIGLETMCVAALAPTDELRAA